MPELFTEFSIDLYQRYILRGDVSDGLLSKMWKRHKFFSMSKEKISYTIMQSSDYSGPQPFLTNFYTGDGYSGTVFGRPALKQMEDAIRAGMVYAVLVKVFLVWDGITVAKLIESRKDIQKLMEQQQKMDKRQNELRKCLATAYEDKVKGVMDGEPFVLFSNQFKKECDQRKETQQKIQAKFETAQKLWDGLARFKKEVEGQVEIKFLTRDIVGQFVDWIAVYPEYRGIRPYTQKIEKIL